MDKRTRRRIRRVGAKVRAIIEPMTDAECLVFMESPIRIKLTKHMPPRFHRQLADVLKMWKAEHDPA